MTVTVSRIPTASMVYAIHTDHNGKHILYKVMTKVIEGITDAQKELRVDSALSVELDPAVPGHVVRATVLEGSHERAAKSANRRELAARAHR